MNYPHRQIAAIAALNSRQTHTFLAVQDRSPPRRGRESPADLLAQDTGGVADSTPDYSAHSASVANNTGALGGTLIASITVTGTGDGVVTWHYSLTNSATQYLAARAARRCTAAGWRVGSGLHSRSLPPRAAVLQSLGRVT
jgi:hypothetical protein